MNGTEQHNKQIGLYQRAGDDGCKIIMFWYTINSTIIYRITDVASLERHQQQWRLILSTNTVQKNEKPSHLITNRVTQYHFSESNKLRNVNGIEILSETASCNDDGIQLDNTVIENDGMIWVFVFKLTSLPSYLIYSINSPNQRIWGGGFFVREEFHFERLR